MRPTTILDAYTLALRQTIQEDEDFWGYLEKGLYWRASAAAYVVVHYRTQAEVFRRRLMTYLGMVTFSQEELDDYADLTSHWVSAEAAPFPGLAPIQSHEHEPGLWHAHRTSGPHSHPDGDER